MTVNEEIKDKNIKWYRVRKVPLRSITIWNRQFDPNNKNKSKMKRYKIMLAIDLIELKRDHGNVFLLSTGKDTGWTTEELAGEYLSEGEIVSIPSGKAINSKNYVKYHKGKFVTTDNRIATSKDTSKLLNKFLYYWLISKSDEINTYYRGTTIAHPDMNSILSMKIPLIPIETQKKIADFLDKKVNAIDRSLEYTKGIIDNLLELRKSYPNTLVVNAKGEKQRLGCLLREKNIKNRPEMQFLSVSRDKGVIIKTFGKKGNPLTDITTAKLIKKGWFVINKMQAWQGAYGVSKYDGIVSPDYYVFDLLVKNKEFFHFAIRTRYYIDQFAKHSYGIRVGQWVISKDELKKTIFYLPSEEKQKEIGEKGTRVVENINRLLEILRKKVKVLEELKQSLIFEVVTGKRDVRDVL